MRLIIVVLLAWVLTSTAEAETLTVWIGMGAPRHGETAGIYRSTLDTDSGALAKPELAAEIDSPGFLALDPQGRVLYSICRLPNGEGGVAAFAIEDDEQSLRLLNTQPTGDGEACHLAVDPSARCLFTAQYGTGSVCVFPLAADGTIARRSAHVRHTGSGPNRARQEGPHPHWVGTDRANRFLFVPDLGADQIVIYRTDLAAGRIEPHGAGRCPAGAGPRHMKFHPNGRFAYVINEMQLSVTAFEYDAETGTLAAIQTISTLPEKLREGANSGSEIRIHPSGQFLYAANRGHDSIAAFEIDPDSGRLAFIEREAVRGSHPRNFNIDPSGKWLLAAGRDSNTISLFRIDAETGSLAYTGTTVNSPAPICIELPSLP
jgi:6-phosphogluconolactonase